MKNESYKKGFKFFFVSLILLFFMRGILTKRLAYSDFTPFNSNYLTSFYRFFFFWNDASFGSFDPETNYMLIRTFFEGISFGNPLLAQNLFLFCLLFVSYSGFYLFLKKFNFDPLINIIFPFIYVINPITIFELSTGGIGSLIIYSIIPLIFLLIFRILENYNLKDGLIFSLLIFISMANIQLAFWVFVGIIPFILSYILYKKINYKNIYYLIIHFIIGLLLNLTFLLKFFNVYKNYLSINYFSMFTHNYSEAFMYNFFRMIGNAGSSQTILGYFEINFINIIAFTLFLFILTYFLSKNKDNNKNIISLFSLTILLGLMIFMTLIRKGYFDPLIINKNLLLVTLRNPQKLFYLFSFTYIILLSLSIDKIYKKIIKKSNKLRGYIILISFLIIFISFNGVALNGDFMQDQARGEGKYFIEDKYNELSNQLQKLDQDSRILYLPLDYPLQMKINWEEKIIKTKMGSKMIIGNNKEDILNNLYEDICSNKINFTQLNNFGVRYVILDKTPISSLNSFQESCKVTSFYDTPYILGNYNYFNTLFSKFEIFYEDNNFVIYDLPPNQDNFKIKSNNSFYIKNNPTKYRIYLENLSSSNTIYFLESYSEGWELYLQKMPTKKWCEVDKYYEKTTRCESKQILFEIEDILHSEKEKISGETHKIVYDYANQWEIDSQDIKNNYSNEYYIENLDGSINIELILYFKPQSYFYWGSLISGITFFGCIAYLTYNLKKKKLTKEYEK
jgi:hypothetical protein